MRTAGFKFRFVLLSACAAFAWLCSVSAQEQSYLDEYKAYIKALENKDPAAAEQHAYAAWQAAEAELGDHKTTATLAYNYGQLVIFTDPKQALSALKRAEALVRAGLVELPERDLQLYIAYTNFAGARDNNRKTGQLRKALKQLDEENVPASPDLARMWFELATADINTNQYRSAQESAARAQAMIAEAAPNDYRLMALAMMTEATAYLMPFPREQKTVIRAVEIYQGAIALFPPQKSIDEFDELFAQALAWEAAAKSVYLSLGYSEKAYPSLDRQRPIIVGRSEEQRESCAIEWAERKPPEYPRSALYRGYVGAVLIGYNLGDGLEIKDARILGEVPAGKFSDATLESAAEWTLKQPAPDRPECRNNLITHISFTIND